MELINNNLSVYFYYLCYIIYLSFVWKLVSSYRKHFLVDVMLFTHIHFQTACLDETHIHFQTCCLIINFKYVIRREVSASVKDYKTLCSFYYISTSILPLEFVPTVDLQCQEVDIHTRKRFKIL